MTTAADTAHPPPRGGGPRVHVAVVGAGIVGVATALTLRREGHQVTLFDPHPAGEACSLGNAAIIAIYGVAPVSLPGIARRVPGMLLRPSGPLSIRWRYLPRLAPWLWRFVRAADPARVEAASLALAALLGRVPATLGTLVKSAGAAPLIRASGSLMIFGSRRSRRNDEVAMALRRRRGIVMEELSPGAAREMEPALTPRFTHAVHLPDVSYTVNPLALTQRLLGDFLARGGRLVAEGVRTVRRGPRGGAGHIVTGGTAPASPRGAGGVEAVVTEAGEHAVDAVVISAGAWSGALAAGLGAPVPLEVERGYHAMLPPPPKGLSRPVLWVDGAFYMVPLEGAVRCAGTVELAGMAAPPNPRRVRAIVRQARRVLPGAGESVSDWMGMRPSMPDSLPVLGPVPGCPGAWLNFGHGHLGLTLAAPSARLIADMISGRDPGLDPAPFAADRF